MAIIYNKEKRIFSLHTEHTTYQMMADTHDYLLHLYYGKRLDSEMDYILTYYDRGFSGNPYDLGNDRTYSLDALPQELEPVITEQRQERSVKQMAVWHLIFAIQDIRFRMVSMISRNFRQHILKLHRLCAYI